MTVGLIIARQRCGDGFLFDGIRDHTVGQCQTIVRAVAEGVFFRIVEAHDGGADFPRIRTGMRGVFGFAQRIGDARKAVLRLEEYERGNEFLAGRMGSISPGRHGQRGRAERNGAIFFTGSFRRNPIGAAAWGRIPGPAGGRRNARTVQR